DAGLAHTAQTVEVTDPAGDEDLGIVRPNERTHPLVVRRRAAVGQDEPPDTGSDELLDEALDGRGRGSPPGERRQALGPWVEPDGQPVAGHGQAGPQVIGA